MSRKLIMFGASYCKPCKRGRQLLEKFGKDTGADIAYIDCAKEYELASRYCIQHVPTFVLEENGSEIARNKGLSLSYFYELVKGGTKMPKKIEFTKPCHDRETKEEYRPGQVKQLKNSRADEIVKAGYAKFVEEAEDDPDN